MDELPSLTKTVETFSDTTKDWQAEGKAVAFKLYSDMVERVPAYPRFLREQGVNPKSIRSTDDFERLPIMTKENYLKKYPLNELCWGGKLTSADIVSVSSGSTGEPSFWPHGEYLAKAGQWYYRLALEQSFQADTKSTLVIVCYTLGTWMAGTHTVDAMVALSESGLPITVVAPGINKVEALKCVKNLGSYYDQILMIGYPPFVKDIIDEGIAEGVEWKRYNVKMMYGGEPFSESWRDYVMEKVGSKRPLLDTANVYAAADAGIMAVETPTSIALHRYANANEEYSEALFGSSRIPTMQQYHPGLRYFEEDDGCLILSTNNSVPLLRYNIKDSGGVITFADAAGRIGGAEKIQRLLAKGGKEAYLSTLPFVYVYGRAHNTATIYALNVYPENVRAAAEDRRVRTLLSGKVKLATYNTAEMNQYLHIIMELAHGIKVTPRQENLIHAVVVEQMQRKNAEYNRLIEAIGEKGFPVIEFVPYGDATFKPGAKMAKVSVKK